MDYFAFEAGLAAASLSSRAFFQLAPSSCTAHSLLVRNGAQPYAIARHA